MKQPHGADARRQCMKPRRRFLLAALALPLAAGAQPAFDHAHSAWDALLRKHVRLTSDGRVKQMRAK